MREWLLKHRACAPGLDWASRNVTSLDQAWREVPYPQWFLWLATRPGVLDEHTIQRFAVFTASLYVDSMTFAYRSLFHRLKEYVADVRSRELLARDLAWAPPVYTVADRVMAQAVETALRPNCLTDLCYVVATTESLRIKQVEWLRKHGRPKWIL